MVIPSWPTKKLGEVILKIGDGGTPSSKVEKYFNGDIPWVNIEDIEKEIFDTRRHLSGLGLRNSSAKLWPKNTIIFSFGASIGKVGIARVPLSTKQGIAGIIPDSKIVNYKFLYYVLLKEAKKIKSIAQGMGSTLKEIRPSKLVNLVDVPLPPLPLQQKIVKILDTIQSAIEVQEKIIETTKELKRSVMAEIFSSKFKIQNSKLQFKIKKWEALGNLVEEKIDYGISKKGHRSGKYPILRMNNLEDGKINTQDLQFVDLTEEEFKKFRLNKDEVIFNRTNSIDLVGKTALFDLDGDFVFASYLLRIRPKRDVILPEFLNYYFNFSRTQKELKSLASRGASQVNISAGRLATFKIPIFSIPEQREIVEILQTIDQKIELEQKKKELYEELFRTMLHKIMSQEIDIDLLGY